VAEQTTMEMIKVEGGQLIDHVKRLVHEGNVRRIRIKQDDETVVEFPLTVGLIGAVLAPVLAAVGAIAAFLTNCTVEIERVEDVPEPEVAPVASGTPTEEPVSAELVAP
jgi:hypothetical protein